MSQTSLGTCRWINKAHSSTWIYSYSMRGTETAKVEGQWPPSNWPKCSVPKTKTTAQRLMHAFLIYPLPRCASKCCDIIKWCHDCLPPLSVGKAICMCSGIALICLHTCWCPCQLFSSAMHEPCCVFHPRYFSVPSYWRLKFIIRIWYVQLINKIDTCKQTR